MITFFFSNNMIIVLSVHLAEAQFHPVDPVDLREVMEQELAPGVDLARRLQRCGHNSLGGLARGGGVVTVLGDLAVVRTRVDAVDHDSCAS